MFVDSVFSPLIRSSVRNGPLARNHLTFLIKTKMLVMAH